jgi:DNA-binding transcriptional LysR family regulator
MNVPVLSSAAEAWVIVAEEVSFTQAARRLHISQPALHAKIAKFVREVGVPLYKRDRSAIFLTEEGEAVAEFIRGLQQQRDDFAITASTSPPLRLIAGEGAYLYLLRPAIAEILGRANSGLSMSLGHGHKALSAVKRRRADVAIGVFDSDLLSDGLSIERIATYPQLVVYPSAHKLARARAVTLADLAKEPLVMPPSGHQHRVRLEQAFREQGLEPQTAVVAEGWELMTTFVALNVGCAVVHGYLPQRPGLSLSEVKDLPPVVYSAVTRDSSAEDPGIRRLVEAVRRTCPRPNGALTGTR